METITNRFPKGPVYIIDGFTGFTLNEALKLWKTRYDTFEDFKKDVFGTPDFYDYVQEIWHSIENVSVTEAFGEPNVEKRRVYFNCIGVERLFRLMKPTLIDKQVIKKKRTKWDDNNDPYEYEFEDVYELYEIEGKRLFERNQWGGEPEAIRAVRCRCTTTNREYWLYVPGSRRVNFDTAIDAIAWTIRIGITDPERIYRQGDIIVAKKSSTSQELETWRHYHLNAEQYLSLMYSET
jgi:hypothetical protein